MKIEILGTGCAKCQKLEALVNDVVAASGVKAQVVKVKDIRQIMNYGVINTPALAIDGRVKITGKMPTPEQVRDWITQ
jgi:small redox-active disulfide protein 2